MRKSENRLSLPISLGEVLRGKSEQGLSGFISQNGKYDYAEKHKR